MQISFALTVKRWVVIGRDELKKLHQADKLISDIHKHQLAIDLVNAIHCDCHEIALVVAAGKQGAIDTPLTFWQHTHVLDLCRQSDLINQVEWVLVPGPTFEYFVLLNVLLTEDKHLSRLIPRLLCVS